MKYWSNYKEEESALLVYLFRNCNDELYHLHLSRTSCPLKPEIMYSIRSFNFSLNLHPHHAVGFNSIDLKERSRQDVSLSFLSKAIILQRMVTCKCNTVFWGGLIFNTILGALSKNVNFIKIQYILKR